MCLMEHFELDLHGKRLYEAEQEVMHFIDHAYFKGEPSCRIIHGMGVIASELPKWLKSYPYVKSFEIDPGNSGATIVRFDL